MKNILFALSLIFLISCSDDKTPPIEVVDELCPDVYEMPDGAENTYVRIVEVLPNPSGSDDYAEMFNVKNYSKRIIDLNTYTIKDDEGTTWKLSELQTYESSSSIPYGCQSIVYISDKVAQLLNSGDTVFLYDYEGNLIQTFEFGASTDGEWKRATKK